MFSARHLPTRQPGNSIFFLAAREGRAQPQSVFEVCLRIRCAETWNTLSGHDAAGTCAWARLLDLMMEPRAAIPPSMVTMVPEM